MVERKRCLNPRIGRGKWKIIFLVTLPNRTQDVGPNVLLRNSAIKFMEETRSIDRKRILETVVACEWLGSYIQGFRLVWIFEQV